jgi:hypothetical protein
MSEINPPQVQGLPLGATTERNAAMVTQQQDANNLAALNNITTGKVGGRRRRKIFRGGFAAASDQFVVPVVQTNYNDPMAGPQSASSQQVGIAGTYNQGSANAVYDDKVAPPTPIPAGQLIKGGRRRKSRKTRNSRKPKKSRKSKKVRKSRKSRK